MTATYKEAEYAKRLELYRQGMTDGEIARATDYSPKAIRSWRNRFGLPRNIKPVDHKLQAYKQEQRLKMSEAGYTDKQMAAALGLTPNAIAAWRRQNGLPPVQKGELYATESFYD